MSKTEENNSNRISEIIAELSECREDERNTQNQILQVISAAGTILGIILGASYINNVEPNAPIVIFKNINAGNGLWNNIAMEINKYVTYDRIMFWLSLFVFFTAFTYIVPLGIGNVMRYFYIQNLEERLHELIESAKDNKDRGDFLHWNDYSAPLITQNPKHITSSYTTVNFLCYVGAIFCVIVFSVIMVGALFSKISPRTNLDIMVLLISITILFLTVIVYAKLSFNAKNVSQFAWDTAHENMKIRLNKKKGELYSGAEDFRRRAGYLLYPKRSDLQKPVLIIAGFISYYFVSGHFIEGDIIDKILRLIFAVFIFDFLIYQARFQINDIRGMEEDMEMGKTDRLFSCGDDEEKQKHAIKISIEVVILRIIAAFVFLFLTGTTQKKPLFISIVALLFVTILYEIVREKGMTKMIFLIVGFGYPMRFIVGVIAANPKDIPFIFSPFMVCVILALAMYGSFASILAWTAEVTKRMDQVQKNEGHWPQSYKKKHFMDIQNILLSKGMTGNPLEAKGKITDPWNLYFFLSLLLLMSARLCIKVSLMGIFGEIIILSVFGISIMTEQHLKKCLNKAIIGILLIRIVLLVFNDFSSGYILTGIAEIIMAITWYGLNFTGIPSGAKMKGKISKGGFKLKQIIIGDYAMKILTKDNQQDND